MHTCNPSYTGSIGRRVIAQGWSQAKSRTLSKDNKQKEPGAWLMVECLSSKCRTLSLKKRRRKRNFCVVASYESNSCKNGWRVVFCCCPVRVQGWLCVTAFPSALKTPGKWPVCKKTQETSEKSYSKPLSPNGYLPPPQMLHVSLQQFCPIK
jgi:hypothetical protein